MKKCRNFLFFVFLAVILSGCARERAPQQLQQPQFVTQIDVTCRRDQQLLQRRYTAPEKMSGVLNYIRLLESQGNADTDPERVTGDVYKIVVHLSDGSRRVYHQRANRYLSKNARPWQQIDPDRAALLYPLLEQTGSDGA